MVRAIESPASSSSSSTSAPTQPYFFPPLALQRRVFCREIIKREGVRSVVEFGCGEGTLLADLCQPAPHLDDFPPFLPPPVNIDSGTLNPQGSAGASGFTLSSLSASEDNSSSNLAERRSPQTSDLDDEAVPTGSELEARLDFLRKIPTPTISERNLHVERLYGCDIRSEALGRAAEATAPPDGSPEKAWYQSRWERWSPLRLELWHGSLDRFNEAFESAECIVASEVIEHLPDEVLKKFGTIVLGKYDARIVVVTTPNYDFNAYFPRATLNAEEEDRHRILDPTGRTDRYFRDDDHRFEWTKEEFQVWARQAADENGFSIEFTGCGSYANYFGGYSMISSDDEERQTRPKPTPPPGAPPPPAEPSNFFATQCAIFRRQFRHDAERSPRSPRPSVLPFLSATSPRISPHRLFASHDHVPHARAGKPRNHQEIRKTLEKTMDDWVEKETTLGSVWNWSSQLREDAGGEVSRVVEAVVLARDHDPSSKWSVEVREGRGLEAVWLIWDREVKPHPPPGAADIGDTEEALGDAELEDEPVPETSHEATGPGSGAVESSTPSTPTISGWPDHPAGPAPTRQTPQSDADGWSDWS